jgi:hypothetical protein
MSKKANPKFQFQTPVSHVLHVHSTPNATVVESANVTHTLTHTVDPRSALARSGNPSGGPPVEKEPNAAREKNPVPVATAATVAPLSTLAAAQRDLGAFGYSASDLQADLDEGRFEWAFDIRTRHSDRAAVRIFTLCVTERCNQLRNPKWHMRRISFEDVLHALFPARKGRQCVSSGDVRRALVCSAPHVFRLIEEKELRVLRGTRYGRGPTGGAQIEWESVVQFLTKRRVR